MQNKKLLLVLVLLVFLVGLAILAGAILIYAFYAPPSMASGTVLELSVGGAVMEMPPSDPWSQLFESRTPNLWELRSALEAAAQDRRVAAVSLEITPLAAGWAQIEELRQLIRKFRNSGKPVHGFLSVDLVTERELYLACSADTVVLNPASGFLIDGLMTEVVFMKRTMDLLGVKPNFIQLKEYKSAETFTRSEMTSEVREMLTGVLQDVQDRFVFAVAEDRGIEEETVRSLIDRGLFPAQTGFEAGLVDRLAYRDEIRDSLAADAEDGEYRGMSLRRYQELQPRQLRVPARANVAYVGALGTIITGRSDGFSSLLGSISLTDTLRSLREDPSIDGIILRVDSPGGSAVASDMIWEEVARLGEEGKPVVISMAGTAASGGYYISMPADRIVAQPSTITGSIGVIFGKFDVSGFYRWLGMDIDRIKLAPNSDFLSLTSSLSQPQQDQIRAWMTEIYDGFVEKAAESRGLSFDEFEPKARGRIYTGSQALEEGLVDAVGGIDQALAEMKRVLDLADSDIVRLELYPRPKTLLQNLASGDLFEVEDPVPGFLNRVVEDLYLLERPAAWLLAPDIRVY